MWLKLNQTHFPGSMKYEWLVEFDIKAALDRSP